MSNPVPTLTEDLISYFKTNIPAGDVSMAEEVIQAAKKGGEALRDFLDGEQGECFEEFIEGPSDRSQDALFLFRNLWHATLPLVDWDEVAKTVAELEVEAEF
jgi:hypothetical protein